MGSESRDSFLFYKSYLEAAKKVRDPIKQGTLLKAILNYGIYFEEPDFSDDEILDVSWELIKPLLDASHKKYGNGKKGGAPKGNQNARKTTENNQEQQRNNRETTENNQKQGKEKEKDKVKEEKEEKNKDKVKDKEKDKYTPNPTSGEPIINDDEPPEGEGWF